MDKTVPAGAALLLAFIYRTETGRDAPECYQVIYGHNQAKLAKPITSMTLDEVEKAQAGWSKRFGSSAAGAAQFMRNTLDAAGTLRDIEGEMGLTGREKFSPDLQDRMAFHLLKRRGYQAFIDGEISMTAFGNRLAMEWASFPVLSDIKGQKRKVKRGQTYYAGDGINKVLTTPEEVEAVLEQVLALAAEPVEEAPAVPDAPTPIPSRPAPSRPGWLHWAMILGVAALVGAAVYFWGQGTLTEEVSLLGDDSRLGLLDGGGGNLFAEIGLQIALSFLAPLVSAAAAAVVGWIVYWWQRVLKVEFDAKSANMLHASLERGLLAAIELLGARAGKGELLDFAADYAATNNPGAVRHFKLTDEKLRKLAIPHLVTAKAAAK